MNTEYLYVQHHSWLFSWLRRKLDCHAQAADIAHDTFLKLLIKPYSKDLQEPRAFLLTIARGLVVDHWRREDLHHAWQEAMAGIPEDITPSVEQQQILLATLQAIARLLETLKPRVREAFLLAQLEDKPYADIARYLGVSIRTVERYIAEALYQCYQLRFSDE
ncbi:sigma-70 family RNA polymerase sigma factor [Methylobacillus gramineus]|uniref:sigma-70 family RNA polymerase sigma factor n=1 Tax=Methylobacillus gramineus TaxID=755169 RepID=UPI001CFFF098|nr:sigma-70 family RNA polymerase sigma factor [Methylobacillus gramineus]MCB5184637.1 sigma-70 family RNA polymerase sigma factor [Methylobacillus gramineus]